LIAKCLPTEETTMIQALKKLRVIPSLAQLLLGAAILCAPLGRLDAQRTGAASQDELLRRIVSDVQHGNFEAALSSSGVALRAAPKDYRIWTLRGMAYSGLQNKPSSLTAFQHALKIAPYYLPALEGAAQLEYQQGDESARPLLLRILSLRPIDPTTHGMLAILDYKKNDCSSAVSHFQQASASVSSQPDGLAMYGRCLAILERFQEAIPIFEQALSLDPSRQSVRYSLALCQWNSGNATDALASLRPLIASESGDERVLELAAGIYESTGETQQAIDMLRKAILANPKKPDAYVQFAYLTYEHGSPKIGIDFLNAGLTQLPQEPELYLVRGILLCQFGEYTKAFDDFETANRLDPSLSYAKVAKGIVQSQAHKSAEALAEFRVAAREHPNEALTQYLLAEAISQQDKPDIAEAIRAADRAIQLDPKLVAAEDLIAGIYLQEGDKQRAIEYSEAALKADPRDQQALYHLILALRKTERKTEIPALMKRLSELRAADGPEDAPQKRLHQLYEAQDGNDKQK
jgi:tetratricopeptide (TPR) repeat protein